MAVNINMDPIVEEKKKKGGLFGLTGIPRAALAVGTLGQSEIVNALPDKVKGPLFQLAGTGVGAVAGAAGGPGGAVGGALAGNQLGAQAGNMSVKPTSVSSSGGGAPIVTGNVAQRRLQASQNDPLATIKQGFLAAGDLPENIKNEVLPPMIQGMSVLSRRNA